MRLTELISNAVENRGAFADAAKISNVRVLLDLLGPAYRGLILKRAKQDDSIAVPTLNTARFDFAYRRDDERLSKLYAAAKSSQWDGATDLEWSTDVDPMNPEVELLSSEMNPLADFPAYQRLDDETQAEHRHAVMCWMLSQFLHGEQGALFAACEVTEAVGWLDGKLYGSTQVVDEGRHVEVFHRYLSTKLEKVYQINDNLYVIIDALMTDSRTDLKFLGMQIMIEGLALGAFSTIRANSDEPLLRELLKRVITDEARHVHYGVVALGDYFIKELSDKERREREDWAYEMALLMRNRFLAHEVYDEYYGHMMSRAEWDRRVMESKMMHSFRRTMFMRIIPNLKRIGLLTDRIRPHYARLGLLDFEHGKAAPDLTAEDLLAA